MARVRPISCNTLPPGDERRLCLEAKNALSSVTPVSSRRGYTGMLQKCIGLPAGRDHKLCFGDLKDVTAARKAVCADRAFRAKCKSRQAAMRTEVGDAIAARAPQAAARLKPLLEGRMDAYVPTPPQPPQPLKVGTMALGVAAAARAIWRVRTPITYGERAGAGGKGWVHIKPPDAQKTYHASLQFDAVKPTGGPYYKDDTTEATSWDVLFGLGSTAVVKDWGAVGFYASRTWLIGFGEQKTGPLSAMTFVTGSERDIGFNWHAARHWDFRLSLGLQTLAQTSRSEDRLNNLSIGPFVQLSGSWGDALVRKGTDADVPLDSAGKWLTLAEPVLGGIHRINSYHALAGMQDAIKAYDPALAAGNDKSPVPVIQGAAALSDAFLSIADVEHLDDSRFLGGYLGVGFATAALELWLTSGSSGYAMPMAQGRVGIDCGFGICRSAARNHLSEDENKRRRTKANATTYATHALFHSAFTLAGFAPGMTATAAGAAQLPFELDPGRRGQLVDFATRGIILYEGTIAGGDNVGMGGIFAQGDMDMGVGRSWLKTYGRIELKSQHLRLDKFFALLQVQDDPPTPETSYETHLANSFGIMLAPHLHDNVRIALRSGVKLTAMYGNPDGHASAIGLEMLGADVNLGTKKAGATLGVTLAGQCAFPNADCNLLMSGGIGAYW